MLKVAVEGAAREDLAGGLDEIVREGARRMLAVALEEDVAVYVAAHVAERDRRAGGWWCATDVPGRGGDRGPGTAGG